MRTSDAWNAKHYTGEDGKTRTTAREGVLKLARLSILTLAVGGIGWSVALGGPEPTVQAAELAARSAPLARAKALAETSIPAAVTLDIDGLRVGAAGTTEQTVRQLLAGLGVHLQPTDRLSVDPAQTLVPGMRLVLDRGLPVTLMDGGYSEAGRAPRGTVAGLLAARGIVLGALDRLEQVSADTTVEPGLFVKITRVSDREITQNEPTDYPVRYLNDPDLETGRQVVEAQGVPGAALRTWLVRYVDGRESARSLLAEAELLAPVAELRRVGVRPRLVPPPPAEIERIIREAAERWGADPVQLMRVAWCESRYNPNAFNPKANDTGLFQFIPETWRRESRRAGYEGVSAFDAVASANTAAMLFAEGKSRLWTCK